MADGISWMADGTSTGGLGKQQPLPDHYQVLQGTLLLLAAAGFLAWLGHRELVVRRDSLESRGWPTTVGEIVASRVGKRTRIKSGTCYWAAVRFRYAVGQELEGSRVAFREGCDRAAAERTVAAYPLGSEVQVSYRPDDPSQSVLEPGSWNGQATLVVSLITAGVLVILSLVDFATLVIPMWRFQGLAEGRAATTGDDA